jgi:hypothetical protein
MNAIYFYTVTYKGKQYRVISNFYWLSKVAEELGLSRSDIARGADSKVPYWPGKD